MKIMCAWCGGIIAYRCEACQQPLNLVNVNGEAILACTSGATTILFHQPDRMSISHGICPQCATAARAHTDEPPQTQADLEQLAIIHLATFKKRGPTGGSADANTPNPDQPKKDGAA